MGKGGTASPQQKGGVHFPIRDLPCCLSHDQSEIQMPDEVWWHQTHYSLVSGKLICSI